MARASPSLQAASGLALGAAGVGFLGVGLWARRTVAQTLAREKIVDAPGAGANGPVASAGAARALADFIHDRALEAAGGRTYAETAPYVDAAGAPTGDAADALKDERTGAPIENPDHALWVQATTLQTALMQAYLAFRLADLTIALGGALALAGTGIAAAHGARR